MAKGQPLTFDLDDEDLKLFNEEAEEQLELLDTALVQLEGEPDPDLVQRIFRAAHTLKGSSATIGHRKMASLTHAMETVLDAVRQDRLRPSSAVVDALLAGLDALRILAHEVVTRVDAGVDAEPLEHALHGLLQEAPPGGATVDAPPAAAGAALPANVVEALLAEVDEGRAVFRVHVGIDANCQLPGIRCFQLLQEIEALATIGHLVPEREVIEAGGGEFSMAAVVATMAHDEQLKAALESVADVASLTIESVTVDATLAIEVPAAPQAAPAVAPAGAKALDAPAPGGRPQLTVVEPGESGATNGSAPRKTTSASVRIDVERLDGLMNLVGELVIDRTRLQQIKDHLSTVLKDANLAELTENFEETTAHLARITDELQEEIMRSRMLPVRSVLTRLPRLVRDVAAKCGKKVELLTAGEETELDRSVIEEISDPLVHILRNAVDHGIETPEERRAAGKPETGTVTVTAWNQETYIYLSIQDDGRGIDTRRLRDKAVERGLVTREMADAASDEAVLQYIFLPGLSLAKKITDVSGRGVGMDIVRTNIERLNGQVSIRSTAGKGSEFIIQLPLTLATTKALMVMSNDTVYAIPLVSVTEALSEVEADLHPIAGRTTLRLRGRLLPVVDLARALGDYRTSEHQGPRFVVAAKHSDRQVAFLVDRLLGEQDVVVKSLGDMLGNRKGITGATILGDGTLGLIIDTASLVAATAALQAIA
ncbi:MAG: chemotaxis protein CheA [Dehalococcoidia bacterium]|nr:chemotaxis protein CheA [Dehalococcoidia bacterium]